MLDLFFNFGEQFALLVESEIGLIFDAEQTYYKIQFSFEIMYNIHQYQTEKCIRHEI